MAMKSADEVYQEIITSYQDLEKLPEGPHLFCPKISDDDEELYSAPKVAGDTVSAEEKQQRISDANQRAKLACWASLILGVDAEKAGSWLVGWKQRVEKFLTNCDACIRGWHMHRKDLLARLLKEFDDDTTYIMEQRLNAFDKARIDRGLKAAATILDEEGPMSTAKLLGYDETAVLALYEALCCVPYLSLPENRTTFNHVFRKTQEKKPLKMGEGVIPTMTIFLFDDDPYRTRFARTAWERLPSQSLTAEQFEWAVSEHLANAANNVNSPGATLEQIRRFWDAIPVLLDAMSEELVLHSLRGMQDADVYNLAIQHLVCNSDEVLATVIKAIVALMQKSSRAFWSALALLPPPQLSMQIFNSPAFKSLLDRSLEDSMMVNEGEGRTPILVSFITVLMESLQTEQRHDVCDFLLRQFLETYMLDHNGSKESKAVCILAGLKALQLTLDGFLDPKYKILPTTSYLYINPLINSTKKYKDVIVGAAELQKTDRYNVGLSDVALSIVQSSLTLDALATRQEWRAAQHRSTPSRVVERQSSQLWDGFRQALLPGKIELAKALLMPTLYYRGVHLFRPGKKDLEVKEDEKKQFNVSFEPTVEVIGRVIDRVSDFDIHTLKNLFAAGRPGIIDPIVASLVHAEDAIREAGVLFIKTLTEEEERRIAITKLLHDYPDTFLASFSDTVDRITVDRQQRQSFTPWPPMPAVLACSRDVLAGLCDTMDGLLRSKTLSRQEKVAVKEWWSLQWQYVDHSFKTTKLTWSFIVPKAVMEDYCRDVMELASGLLIQDGVIASALGDPSDGIMAARALKEVLDAPRLWCVGLVEMLQLRDPYLVRVIVGILTKLLGRLKDNNIEPLGKALELIRNACTPNPTVPGKYLINTIMDNQQRAELQKALGDDNDADVEIVAVTRRLGDRLQVKPKKQTLLEQWSSSGTPKPTPSGSTTPKQTPAARTMKDYMADMTANTNKHKATLDKIKTKHAVKEQKTLVANAAAIKEARARDAAERQKNKDAAIAKARALRQSIVPGEGSGLQGVAGVIGKDHAPMKSEILVNSESEEESEDEDEDDMAALLEHSASGEKSLAEAELRRQKLLAAKARGPVKKVKVQRSAKDMRARLIPDMAKLHQAILEWDIFHQGNDPPNGYKCEKVADNYLTPKAYKETFFPLLVYEAWRSFVTSKDETTAKPFGVKVLTRMTVDNFLEVTTSMPKALNKDRNLTEGDIVILSKAQDPLNQPNEPHCLARIWKTTYKRDVLEVAYRLSAKGNQILPVLLPSAEFQAVKITNMTTIEREYAALESLQYYDLMDEVLSAEPSPALVFSPQRISTIQETYQLNPGQAKAIINAKENDGFTLVQGPPGTGKTKTIVAMVGVLLSGLIKNNSSAVAISRPIPGQNGQQAMPKKLLVCAPSNAAVDELVLRLKAGVVEENGTRRKINVLRLGRSDAINAGVKDVTLDELVKAEFDAQVNQNSGPSDKEKLHQEAGEIKAKLAELRPALEAASFETDNREHANALQREIDQLRARQRQIGAQIDRDKDSGNTFAREADIKRRQIQQRILNDAHVLCATLSGSGHEMFKNLNVEFETVIIDEAAQCVELGALIPLKYGCSKCVLVGDPKQLPPTVLSQSAARYGYDQSLFVRMQQNHPNDVHLLEIQYRMHPEISLFPSEVFYDKKLVDGDGMATVRRQPWHDSALLGPYRFFDVEGVQERGHKGQSLVNVNELQVAMQLYQRFRTDYSNLDLKGKIGIITPYKAQLFALRSRFTDKYGEEILQEIEFNTTDAFQGRECEIIIFSCVRASPKGGIGFMTDIRRMNVGLTRAKSSLWILGDSRALRQGPFWHQLIDNAKSRDRYTSGDILTLLRRPGVKGAPQPGFNGAVKKEQIKPLGTVDKDGDIEMKNVGSGTTAPSTPQSIPSRKPQPQPQASNPYSTPFVPPGPDKRIDGLNEKGEAVPLAPRSGHKPVVHTSASVPKKRPAEDDGVTPPSKKLHQGPSAQKVQIPTGPRAMQGRPVPPPPRPTDPSAMDVLGLNKPSPAAQTSSGPGRSTSDARGGAPPPPRGGGRPPPPPPKKSDLAKGGMVPPRKKAPVDPFVKRKPPRR